MTTENQKVWTPDEIRSNIQYSYKWLVRAVLALYRQQTEEERLCNTTIARNNKGFDVIDAKYMSKIAQQIESRKYLSMRDQYLVRKILRKYHGQLTRIANSAFR
jgi:hypothetical protein